MDIGDDDDHTMTVVKIWITRMRTTTTKTVVKIWTKHKLLTIELVMFGLVQLAACRKYPASTGAAGTSGRATLRVLRLRLLTLLLDQGPAEHPANSIMNLCFKCHQSRHAHLHLRYHASNASILISPS